MERIVFFVIVLGLSAVIVPTHADQISTVTVGSETVSCEGVGIRDCMIIKLSERSGWTLFYDRIEGFEFESGYQYKLSVLVTEKDKPPADSSALEYSLLEILEKKDLRHFPYMGLCAPGFVESGGGCTLDKRCGPVVFAGKICEVDGARQDYLKPAQQGHAGITAGNVICTEELELIFKSADGSPACVTPSSAERMKVQGWQGDFPTLACTLEYAPVCGVDGKTYGNMCMLKTEHMALEHVGECDE